MLISLRLYTQHKTTPYLQQYTLTNLIPLGDKNISQLVVTL